MARLFRAPDKAGLPPGTPVHVGARRIEQVRVTVIRYDEASVEEQTLEDADQAADFRQKGGVTWVNVDGLHRADIIENIGAQFDLHPLILEDILNTGQRPKIEDYQDYLYVVLKMLSHDADRDEIEAEQVSLVMGPGYVLSFQERPGDVFESVRERIRGGKGRVRTVGSDYLVYSLIDAVVDSYFVICEAFGEKLERLEDRVIAHPEPASSREIHAAKREAIMLRKSLWPLREVINGLLREEPPLVSDATHLYLRDVYDHTIQVIDTIESFRDVLSGLLDIYLTSISNRMNEVMKVLTIIATIFIPLTFIAGVYGMNFRHMPELDWPWAYPAVWGVMIVIAVVMVVYFRRKRWL